MLLIQNGRSMIPDSDRFVGIAGDNMANTAVSRSMSHLLSRGIVYIRRSRWLLPPYRCVDTPEQGIDAHRVSRRQQ